MCNNPKPRHPACPGVPLSVPREQPACLWQVEKEMTLLESPRMRGPEGRPAKREPSPEGLGIYPEDDPPAPACRGSAVGAALNLWLTSNLSSRLPRLAVGPSVAEWRDLRLR